MLVGRERAGKVSHVVLLSPGSAEALEPTLRFPDALLLLLAPLIKHNFRRSGIFSFACPLSALSRAIRSVRARGQNICIVKIKWRSEPRR